MATTTYTYEKYPLGWNNANFQSLFNALASLGTRYATGEIPTLSEDYWTNLRAKNFEMANISPDILERNMLNLAQRGLEDSGIRDAAMANLLAQSNTAKANMLRDLAIKQAEMEATLPLQYGQLAQGITGTLGSINSAIARSRLAAAANALARQRFDWSKKLAVLNALMGYQKQNQYGNTSIFNTGLNAWQVPQQIGMQYSYNLANAYGKQAQADQQRKSSMAGILGTIGGIAGNAIAPGVGGAIGSALGGLVGSFF